MSFASWANESCCLKGTHLLIFDQIMAWAQNGSYSIPKVFWFTGPAGSGKTTIAHSIAKKLDNAGMLGSAFFFKCDKADQSDPAKVITTLAYDMASHNLNFKVALADILKVDSLIPTSLSAQFEKILLRPLVACGQTEHLCLVLDAFYECGTHESREPLLAALAGLLPKLPGNIKLFVTSCTQGPNADIDQVFAKQLASMTNHLDLDSTDNQADILQYTQYRLKKIAQTKELDEMWPELDTIQKLADSADGLFLWNLPIHCLQLQS